MASESTEDRLTQGERETRRASPSSPAPSQPVRPPFLTDGLELVRDCHC